MTTFNWVNLVLIIIVIIYLIVITIIYFNNVDNVTSTGVPINQVFGTKTGSSDTYVMRGNNIYIGQSTAGASSTGFVLNVNSSGDQVEGQVTYIKNTTSNALTVRSGTASINVAGLTNTIVGGHTAIYIANSSNGWMRLL